MRILACSTRGATIEFGQNELLLAMALVREGIESFGCNSDTSRKLEEQLCLANLLVEDERRETVKTTIFCKEICTFGATQAEMPVLASNN